LRPTFGGSLAPRLAGVLIVIGLARMIIGEQVEVEVREMENQ
jgi:hypothetical protein